MLYLGRIKSDQRRSLKRNHWQNMWSSSQPPQSLDWDVSWAGEGSSAKEQGHTGWFCHQSINVALKSSQRSNLKQTGTKWGNFSHLVWSNIFYSSSWCHLLSCTGTEGWIRNSIWYQVLSCMLTMDWSVTAKCHSDATLVQMQIFIWSEVRGTYIIILCHSWREIKDQ